jgi:hypothetical protein
MESLRQSLVGGILKRIEKELGRDTTLRLLWPHLVGQQLAGNTQLKAVRGPTLIVAVPDRGWKSSLEPLKQMILDTVNGAGGERSYAAIEFVEQPDMALPPKASGPRSSRSQRALPAVELDTAMIGDEAMRRMFTERARKYFAAQSEREKEERQEEERS